MHRAIHRAIHIYIYIYIPTGVVVPPWSYISDVYTTAANVNNGGDDGLYVFKTPPPSTTPNAFGELEEEQGSPWDWWDNATYDQMHQAVHGSPAGYGAANSLLGNPNMSATKGNAYLDTIQGYLNPRMYLALGLGTITVSVSGCTDSLATNYNPLATIDDGSCIYCNISVSFLSNNPSTLTSCDGFVLANMATNYPIVSYSWINSQGSFMGNSNFISNHLKKSNGQIHTL